MRPNRKITGVHRSGTRALERQIEHTDPEIDRLVYHLYGLSDQEIAVVEEATR